MKKSYRILQLQFYKGTIHIHQSREFTIQNPINSTHRRQGDLLEIHPCLLHDIPGIPAKRPYRTFQIFQTFQSFMTYSLPGNSSYSRDSNPLQHSPIRMHILQFDWFPQKLHRVPVGQYKLQTTNITFFKEREMLRYRSNKTLFSRIELFSSIVLSPRVANYKNDIHKFL